MNPLASKRNYSMKLQIRRRGGKNISLCSVRLQDLHGRLLFVLCGHCQWCHALHVGLADIGPDLRFKTTQGTSEHEGDAEPRVSQWNEPGQGCKYQTPSSKNRCQMLSVKDCHVQSTHFEATGAM